MDRPKITIAAPIMLSFLEVTGMLRHVGTSKVDIEIP